MKPTPSYEIIASRQLVAYCGLYCGACRSYRSGKCPGCRENEKAHWCKVRSCCVDNKLTSCADCTSTELGHCKKYNTLISKVIGVVFNSNRSACIERIKIIGMENFAVEMAQKGRQSLPRK